MGMQCAGCGGEISGDPLAPEWTCGQCGRIHSNPGAAGAAPSPAVVAENRPCLACGYSLKGLSVEGRCPECGVAIARSLRGNLLEFASPDYLVLLRRGALTVVLGTLGSLVAALLVFVVGIIMILGPKMPEIVQAISSGTFTDPMQYFSPGTQHTWSIISALREFAADVVVLAGWWMLSSPDPALVGPDQDMHARRVLRVTLVIAAVATLGAFVSTLVPAAGGLGFTGGKIQLSGLFKGALASILATLFSLGILAAVIVKFFASLNYVRAVAARVPDAALMERARMFRWLLPVLLTVGTCLVIGPIAAKLLYAWLLFELSKRIASALERARAAAAEA